LKIAELLEIDAKYAFTCAVLEHLLRSETFKVFTLLQSDFTAEVSRYGGKPIIGRADQRVYVLR
jgi:hypothetical protein